MRSKKIALQNVTDVIDEFYNSSEMMNGYLSAVEYDHKKDSIAYKNAQLMMAQQNPNLAFTSSVMSTNDVSVLYEGPNDYKSVQEFDNAISRIKPKLIDISEFSSVSKGKVMENISFPKYLLNGPRKKNKGKNATLEIIQIINFAWKIFFSGLIKPPSIYSRVCLTYLKESTKARVDKTLGLQDAKKIMEYLNKNFPNLLKLYSEHKAQNDAYKKVAEQLREERKNEIDQMSEKIDKLSFGDLVAVFGMVSSGLSNLNVPETTKGSEILKGLLNLSEEEYINSVAKDRVYPRLEKDKYRVVIYDKTFGSKTKNTIGSIGKPPEKIGMSPDEIALNKAEDAVFNSLVKK